MKKIKEKLWYKTDGAAAVIAVILIIIAAFAGQLRLLSDIFFMVGLVLICLAVANILLHASLLSGWFKKKKKGHETDDEYQQEKIDVETVGSKKNRPIHFEQFAINCSLFGICLIIISILTTL